MSKLGDTLMSIEDYPYRDDGSYSLFLPCGLQDSAINADTPSMVLFYTLEEADNFVENQYQHPEAEKHNFCDSGSLSLVKRIVRAAKQDKPDVSPDELVMAYLYYFENDGYYPFD